MSDKQTFFLINPQVKQNAMLAIKMASEDMICEIKKKTRSLEQNAKMWAMLAEVSDQVNWYGNKLTSDEWKDVGNGKKRASITRQTCYRIMNIGKRINRQQYKQRRKIRQSFK